MTSISTLFRKAKYLKWRRSWLGSLHGFRFLVYMIASAMLLALYAYVWLFCLELPLIELFNKFWSYYIFSYWQNHIGWGLLFFSIWSASIASATLEELFYRYVPLGAPEPKQEEADKLFKTANICLWLILGMLLCIILPVAHLGVPKYNRVAYVMLNAFAMLFTFWTAFVPPKAQQVDAALATFRFQGITSFDVASLGGQATAVKDEIINYNTIIGQTPLSQRGLAYIMDGADGEYWTGFKRFMNDLEEVVGISKENILLHDKTTSAIMFAVKHAASVSNACITTDCEYASVSRALEREFQDRLTTAKVKGLVHKRNASPENINEAIISACQSVASANVPVCIVVSHVLHQFGTVLDIKLLSKSLIANKIDHILIVDGAQAVGNIFVDGDTLSCSHFYATSGHKWLLGRPALGILAYNPTLLSRFKITREVLLQSYDRPFSNTEFEAKDYTKETISLEPTVSLGVMLHDFKRVGLERIAAHNLSLARLFEQCLMQDRIKGIEIVTCPVNCGIVAIKVAEAERIRAELEQQEGIVVQTFEGGQYLRFCFHYYARRRDVVQLYRALRGCVP